MLDHIAVILDRLRADQQAALDRALADLIPPWCEGLTPDFWQTEAGEELAVALWVANRDEALSLTEATRLIFGADRSQRGYRAIVGSALPIYALPTTALDAHGKQVGRSRRWYVLRADVLAFQEQRSGPKVTKKERLRAWFEADLTRLSMGKNTAHRAFTEETGVGVSIPLVVNVLRELRKQNSAEAEKGARRD